MDQSNPISGPKVGDVPSFLNPNSSVTDQPGAPVYRGIPTNLWLLDTHDNEDFQDSAPGVWNSNSTDTMSGDRDSLSNTKTLNAQLLTEFTQCTRSFANSRMFRTTSLKSLTDTSFQLSRPLDEHAEYSEFCGLEDACLSRLLANKSECYAYGARPQSQGYPEQGGLRFLI